MAAAMITPTATSFVPMSVSADHAIVNTVFNSHSEPWQLAQSSPAEQYAEIRNGAFHITIMNPTGADKSNYDLQFRHRNLSFKKGHTYKVSFKAKAKRDGMELCSKFSSISGENEYFVLDGRNNEMMMGNAMGGNWGTPASLTTEYQTFEGIFTPTEDIENCEWTFHYANDINGYGGNAQSGDEIWFDDMSVVCETCHAEYPEVGCGYTGDVDIPDDPDDKPVDTPDDKPAEKDGHVIIDSTFDYNAVPWQTASSLPARQTFSLDDGAYHITIMNPTGADKSNYDLQFRHRNLSFKKGHTYKVSFKAKAKRDGMELCSKFSSISGENEYFVLDGRNNEMIMGNAMGGNWGTPASLTTEYQTFEGIFTPTEDIENCEWTFHYANDSNGYGGNAQSGDEIWFDDMSVVCKTCHAEYPEVGCGYTGNPECGYTSRDYAAKNNPELMTDGEMTNYISVNQLGYFPKLAKIATFGDNQGDMLPGASKIELTNDNYDFELIDVSTGLSVYEGTSGTKFKDHDSGDNVCKLDFSEFQTPGEYFLHIKGENWRSFSFRIGDDIYSGNMLTNALNYYYQSRSGMDIKPEYITSGDKNKLAHEATHETDKAYVQKIWCNEYTDDKQATETYASAELTASGGWYDSCDYTKSLISGGMSVWILQNMYERTVTNGSYTEKFEDNSGVCVIPEAGNDIPDILDETAYELDWMASMKVSKDDTTWGEYDGLYYHKLQDYTAGPIAKTPHELFAQSGSRIVKPPTFAATLNYAACAAQAARLWAPYDTEKSEKYFNSAVEAYDAYLKHYYEYDFTQKEHPVYGIPCPAEEINETSLYAPAYHSNGGDSYGVFDDVDDEAYWAACEIFVSASEMGKTDIAEKYKTALSESDYAFDVNTRIYPEADIDTDFTSFKWEDPASAGSLSLALHPEFLSDKENDAVKRSILNTSANYIDTVNEQGYGIPYKYDGPGYNDPVGLDPSIITQGYMSGSNPMSVTNAIVMAYAYDITGDIQYINGVAQTMDYLLGNNPLSFSYITGYGSYSVQNPSHWKWQNDVDSSSPKAPAGILVGGASVEITDDYMRYLGFVPGINDNVNQRCYSDSSEAWSVNETALEWNAPLAWVVSFLDDEASNLIYTIDNPGDVNGDGKVLLNDAVLILQHLGNPDGYPLSDEAALSGDVYEPGSGLTNNDALKIQQYLLGMAEL